MRSRSEKLWLGEGTTKRTLSDETWHAHRNEMKEIHYSNLITRDQKTIERAFVEHYRGLFGQCAQKGTRLESEFLTLMPRLEGHLREGLEAPISVSELEAAIEALTNGKTPGPDGLCVDFYKRFKKEAADALYEVLSEACKKSLLPSSFLKSHIVLVPKFDDRVKLLSVSSYRPIITKNLYLARSEDFRYGHIKNGPHIT